LFANTGGYASLCARDPFYLTQKKVTKVKKVKKIKTKKESAYVVKGIIELDGCSSAIVSAGGRTKIVKKGDVVGNYTIVNVKKTTVVAKINTKKNNFREEIWFIG
jgi:hypothetical protein